MNKLKKKNSTVAIEMLNFLNVAENFEVRSGSTLWFLKEILVLIVYETNDGSCCLNVDKGSG